MQDVGLVIVMIGIVAYTYIVIEYSDKIFGKSKRTVTMESTVNKIHILAESPTFMNGLADMIKKSADLYPFIEFSLGVEKIKDLLKTLNDGDVDIVLISEEHIKDLVGKYSVKMVSYSNNFVQSKLMDLSISDLSNNGNIYVVWNENICSLNRDRILTLI